MEPETTPEPEAKEETKTGKVTIEYSFDLQKVTKVECEPGKFKSTEMMKAALEGALEIVKFNLQLQQMQGYQQQMQAQMQDAAIVNGLRSKLKI